MSRGGMRHGDGGGGGVTRKMPKITTTLGLLSALIFCAVELSVVSARPYVLPARGGGGGGGGNGTGTGTAETKGARRERLIDMVTAGEASATLISEQPPITAAEEDAPDDTAVTVDPADVSAASAGAPDADLGAVAAAAGISDASVTDPGDPTQNPKKRTMVQKAADGILSQVVKPSFFAKKYFGGSITPLEGDAADGQDGAAPAPAADDADAVAVDGPAGAAVNADAVIDAATAATTADAMTGAAATLAVADAATAPNPVGMTDDEMATVLAQATAAEGAEGPGRIHFIKPTGGAGGARDGTVRPMSPPPALAPYSAENLRKHYVAEAVPEKRAKAGDLYGAQVHIIGGSDARYRGVRCPLYGDQVPIIGGSGAHDGGFRCPL